MSLRDRLIVEEGRRHLAYRDSLGLWTIGVGHHDSHVHEGLTWTDEQIDAALDNDIDRARQALRQALPWTSDLDPVRRDVLVDMAFNMGIGGLLKFKNTLAMVKAGHYEDAAKGMLHSLWALQVKGRAVRLARIMATGQDE